MKKPFDINAEYQPESFAFKQKKKVKEILERYPAEQKRSAVMPLLDLAQRQMGVEGAKAKTPFGGWIPRAAMDEIANIIDQPPIRVYEVATFYSMYQLAPVGKYLIQLCTTSPCWLAGCADIQAAMEKHLDLKMGGTSKDGLFTMVEVECLGACVNAPMMQINDDYYEDLTAENIIPLLDALKNGKKPPSAGSLAGRKCSMSCAGPTSLMKQAEKAGVV